MPTEKKRDDEHNEPEGFTPEKEGPASKAAHEQGWGLNEEERTTSRETPAIQGGTDYDYGAHDFGDTATRTGNVPDPTRAEDVLDPKKKAS